MALTDWATMGIAVQVGDTVAPKDGPWKIRGIVKALHKFEKETMVDVEWNSPTMSRRVNIKSIKKI